MANVPLAAWVDAPVVASAAAAVAALAKTAVVDGQGSSRGATAGDGAARRASLGPLATTPGGPSPPNVVLQRAAISTGATAADVAYAAWLSSANPAVAAAAAVAGGTATPAGPAAVVVAAPASAVCIAIPE